MPSDWSGPALSLSLSLAAEPGPEEKPPEEETVDDDSEIIVTFCRKGHVMPHACHDCPSLPFLCMASWDRVAGVPTPGGWCGDLPDLSEPRSSPFPRSARAEADPGQACAQWAHAGRPGSSPCGGALGVCVTHLLSRRTESEQSCPVGQNADTCSQCFCYICGRPASEVVPLPGP